MKVSFWRNRLRKGVFQKCLNTVAFSQTYPRNGTAQKFYCVLIKHISQWSMCLETAWVVLCWSLGMTPFPSAIKGPCTTSDWEGTCMTLFSIAPRSQLEEVPKLFYCFPDAGTFGMLNEDQFINAEGNILTQGSFATGLYFSKCTQIALVKHNV